MVPLLPRAARDRVRGRGRGNYQYLLDRISQLVSRSIQSESVVVFDEAHNIDNICIEVMSINFRTQTLEACSRN